MKPSYEQLEAENAALKKEVAELKALVAQLLSRIADLESQLKQNSKNSSKPPSSDQKVIGHGEGKWSLKRTDIRAGRTVSVRSNRVRNKIQNRRPLAT